MFQLHIFAYPPVSVKILMRNRINRIDVNVGVDIDISIDIRRFILRTWLIQGKTWITFQFMFTEPHRSGGFAALYRLVQGRIGHYGNCFEFHG